MSRAKLKKCKGFPKSNIWVNFWARNFKNMWYRGLEKVKLWDHKESHHLHTEGSGLTALKFFLTFDSYQTKTLTFPPYDKLLQLCNLCYLFYVQPLLCMLMLSCSKQNAWKTCITSWTGAVALWYRLTCLNVWLGCQSYSSHALTDVVHFPLCSLFVCFSIPKVSSR